MLQFVKQDLDLLTDEEITLNFQKSVKEAIEHAKANGKPVCGFDSDTKRSYILYPDGTKEYAEA